MASGIFSVRSGTRTGNFNIPLSLMESVSGLATANLNAVAVDGNGITGVVFAVNGSGRSYNIAVTLPDAATGQFRLSLHGMVTVGGITEAVTSNEVTIQYDTASTVMARWGEAGSYDNPIQYLDEGLIILSVTFDEDIAYFHKTDFTLESVEGEEVWECIDDYWLTQRADDAGNLVNPRTFYLHFQMAPNKRQGRFRVSLTGYVYKTLDTIRDEVSISPIEIPYSTIEPRSDVDMPTSYDLGSPLDVFVAYNVVVTGWNANNTITTPGIFEREGANLGTPSAYKWIGISPPPDFEALRGTMPNLRDEEDRYDASANNEALLVLGWQPLASPPAGPPTEENKDEFSSDGTWHGEAGQYYLIRFFDPQESGTFRLREQIGIVRGPTH